MIGRVFGRLTVVDRGPDRSNADGTRVIRWYCNCSCGNRSLVSGIALRSGAIVSCGCYRNDMIAMSLLKPSHGEIWIDSYLSSHGYSYDKQVTFSNLYGVGHGLLSYDFSIHFTSFDVLVECQGEQHFHPVNYFGGESTFRRQLVHDKLKTCYVDDNDNLKLITIKYFSQMKKLDFLNDFIIKLNKYNI